MRVENLRVHFPVHGREHGLIRAVDGVSFSLRRGEVLALVGAKGCGKTTVARAVALLTRPDAGRVVFQSKDLTSWRGRHFRRARRRIQIVFSNPYVAFAPRLTVKEVVTEALGVNKKHRLGRDREEKIAELLSRTGLNYYLSIRYPRDLSGGQRQRLALARALAAEPDLLICDQPTDHLDPAVGEKILRLLHQLNRQLGLTMLLTSRRLELARYADRVAVMVQGRIVEMGYYDDLVRQPLHPFTQALTTPQSADQAARQSLDALNPAPGCRYAPLCSVTEPRCHEQYPAFVKGAVGHGVACHLVQASD